MLSKFSLCKRPLKKKQQNVGSNYEHKYTNKSMSMDYDNSSKPQVIC